MEFNAAEDLFKPLVFAEESFNSLVQQGDHPRFNAILIKRVSESDDESIGSSIEQTCSAGLCSEPLIPLFPILSVSNIHEDLSDESCSELDVYKDVPLQNEFQTIINTINLYVGCGILSIGYAIMLTGWIGILVLGVCTFFMSLSAKYICYSFDFLKNDNFQSYPALGFLSFGTLGNYSVLIAIILEFWGALGVCLIIIWQSLESIIPPISVFGHYFSSINVTIFVTMLFVFPSVWIRSFARLSFLSVIGKLGTILILFVVIVAYGIDTDSSQVQQNHDHKFCDISYIPMAIGIFVVSLSGHAGLPSLRRNMKNKQNFNFCIDVTFFSMFILYAAMGIFSYLYFGNSLQVLVTTNLNTDSSVDSFYLFKFGYFSLSITQFLLILVALSVYTTIAPLVYVITELVLDLCGNYSPISDIENLIPYVRTLVVVITYITALIGYDYLENVESVVGGFCSVMVSLLLPTLIYLKLNFSNLGLGEKSWMLFLATFGVICVLGIPIMNILEIVNG